MKPIPEAMRIGLTGGIACGKSTVLSFFRQMGFFTFSADEEVHHLLEADTAVRVALATYFGSEAFDKRGRVNRAFLADQVFFDFEKLKFLEGLLHPRVQQAWENAIESAPDHHWIIEIPLLFEKNLEKHFDFNVCVACLCSTQVQRLAKKGFNPQQIKARLALHLPIEEKMHRSQFVFWNEGSVDFLSLQVSYWNRKLLSS